MHGADAAARAVLQPATHAAELVGAEVGAVRVEPALQHGVLTRLARALRADHHVHLKCDGKR